MPLYPFKCEQCGEQTNLMRAVDDRNKPYPCECGNNMVQDLVAKFKNMQFDTSFPGSSKNPGATIFEGGKKKHLTSKADIKDYEVRNGMTCGSDEELTQEANKYKKQIQEEKAEATTNKIMDDIERKKVLKRK